MAHSIVVDLLLRTGAFESDTKRAERALERMQKQASAAGAVLGTALAAGATAAAYAFDKLVKGAADFQDMAETTGASAEDLASLAVAAGTAGVEMQTLAGNSIRLTKSLTGVDDESKAAGAAIKALGLDLGSFKKLDPVAQIDALTKAFGSFADGPGKAAVAVALWGKSGAEMLKVMKALEEQGGRTKILTQEQITLADAYADVQAKATTELKLYAQAGATQMLPALTALTTAAIDFTKELIGIDVATGQLAVNNGIAKYAWDAAEAFAELVDVIQRADRFLVLLNTLSANMGGAIRAKILGDAKASAEIMRSSEEALKAFSAPLFGEHFRNARAAAMNAASPLGEQLGLDSTLLSGPPKKQLDFEGAAEKAKKAAKYTHEFSDAIDDMLSRIKAGDELKLSKLLDTMEEMKKFVEGGGVLPDSVWAALAEDLAKLDPAARDAKKALDLLADTSFGKQDAMLAKITEINRLFAAGAMTVEQWGAAIRTATGTADDGLEKLKDKLAATPTGKLNAMLKEIEFINGQFAAGAVTVDQWAELIRDATGTAENGVAAVSDAAKDLGLTFSSAFEDAIVGGEKLSDVLKGLEKDILRIVTRELITKPIANSITGMLSSAGASAAESGGGNAFASFLSSIFGGAKAGGGDVMAGRAYLVGEKGPEMFVPRTAGMVLANQSTAGGPSITVNQTFAFAGPVDRRTVGQVYASAARGMSDASNRHN